MKKDKSVSLTRFRRYYDKMMEKQQNTIEKINRAKEELEIREMRDVTFKPRLIAKNLVPNDKKMV